MQRLWPSPAAVVCATASYVRVPERETIPMEPARWMWPGMMPILHWPGRMIPGQFGPSRRDLLCWRSASVTWRRMSGSVGQAANLDHVVLGDPLGDAHDQPNLALDRLEDGCRSEGRRNVDNGRVGTNCSLGLLRVAG